MRKLVFWTASGLIAYTHAGYPLLLSLLARRRRPVPPPPLEELPAVSLIIAAYDEQDVIGRRVRNAKSLDYPRLEVIVVSDGSTDATVERAREAGADVVIDAPHAGKVRAQDAGVSRSSGQIVAFSDANVAWERDALRRLVEPFADPKVGYVCGHVEFVRDDGTNEEGAYWRYETAIRALESQLAGVTAGNGAIYATRRDSYVIVDARMGHDLSFPFNMVKRGWRPVYEPAARAEEKMVPSIEGEFRRKRRMMSHTWPIVVRGGMLDLHRYPPLYALEIVSHRLLRYCTPFLHLAALGSNLGLTRRIYRIALAVQLAGLTAAAAGPFTRVRATKLAYYYLLVTASPALGLVDWLRTGTPAGWTKAEGTR